MEPTEQNSNPTSESASEPKQVTEPALEPAKLAEELPAGAISEPPAGTISEPSDEPVNPMINQPNVEDKPKKTSFKMIIIIVVILVLCVGGVVATLFLTGVIKFGGESVSNDLEPTPELAKSVCEKYGGKFSNNNNSQEGIISMYYCEKDDDEENSDTAFSYEMAFIEDDKIDEFRRMMKSSLLDDYSVSLEDSDTYTKIYVPPSDDIYLVHHSFAGLYKNVAIELQVNDGIFGEDLLVELGFPNRSRKESFDKIEKQGSSSLNDAKLDTEYRDDLASLSSLMNQYLTNNRGRLPKISEGKLEGFDSYLETGDYVDEVTGNNYSLVAFDSFTDTEYEADDSLLNSIKSDEIYVFYKATCESNNKIVGAENPRKVVFVHSSANNDKYYCTGN